MSFYPDAPLYAIDALPSRLPPGAGDTAIIAIYDWLRDVEVQAASDLNRELHADADAARRFDETGRYPGVRPSTPRPELIGRLAAIQGIKAVIRGLCEGIEGFTPA